MKKLLSTLLLAVICVICSVVTACNNGNPPKEQSPETKGGYTYEISDLSNVYSYTHNEDGSITVSGNDLHVVNYKQVINGDFKANTTYIITLTASINEAGGDIGWVRVIPSLTIIKIKIVLRLTVLLRGLTLIKWNTS